MILWLVGFVISSASAHSQSQALLPDAPQPSSSGVGAQPLARPAHHHWQPYLNPGQPIHPLTPGQKLRFWLHLEVAPTGPMASFVASGFEQGIDSNPKFGTDSGAFGERLGAAFIRDASMRFFVSSLFPVVLRQDPRYYRVASGSIVHRGLEAGRQALVTRTDSGRTAPNYSDILGHLAACALTPLYYPAPSANGRVVVEAWATSIAGDAGNNLILEFWPSIAQRWRRHRERVRARRSSRSPVHPSIP